MTPFLETKGLATVNPYCITSYSLGSEIKDLVFSFTFPSVDVAGAWKKLTCKPGKRF
jgi:hypothetical protein